MAAEVTSADSPMEVNKVKCWFLEVSYGANANCCTPLSKAGFQQAFVTVSEDVGICVASSRPKAENFQGRIIVPKQIADIEFRAEQNEANFQVLLSKPLKLGLRKISTVIFRGEEVDEISNVVKEIRQRMLLHCAIYTVSKGGKFPESLLDVKNKTAVCISGGGKRSHLCAGGQLRALHHLGLLNRDTINYLSSTSGGAWATSIYTFYESASVENDDMLLGNATLPSNLTLDFLKAECSPIGDGGKISIEKNVKRLLFSVPTHEVFTRTIGKVFLDKFGLNNDNPFAMHETYDIVAETNPLLRLSDFNLSRPKRPFWITNATMLGPRWSALGDMVPIQFTGLYCGSPFLHKIHYEDRKRWSIGRELEFDVGGGMVDTFAFGGLATAKKTAPFDHMDTVNSLFSYISNKLEIETQKLFLGVHRENFESDEVLKRFITVPQPKSPFSVRDACGIVGTSYALSVRNKMFLNRLVPHEPYYNVLLDKQKGILMQYADGGFMDNLAILPVLQRQVERIVVFFNGYIPLPDMNVVDTVTYETFPSSNLIPLFGVQVEDYKFGNFNQNQVFEEAKLKELLLGLFKKKEAGEPAVMKQTLSVLENSFWNIRGDWEVEIIWFYLEKSENFLSLLPDETREELEKGMDGSFNNFPHYSTFTKDTYTDEEINLLQAYTEWSVMENKDMLLDFLKP